MRDWMFSSVVSGFVPANSGSSACVILLEEAADADHLKANAKVRRQLAAVVDRAGRRVGAGHADAQHILRAQSICGDGRHQRGIDAAAQRHQHLAETRTCAHNRACPAPSPGRQLLCRLPAGLRIRRSVEWIDHNQILFERGSLRNQLAVRVEGQRGAVEDQAVVAAHLVAHQHRNSVAPGNRRQHLAAHGPLAVPERRRREVDMHGRVLAHQLFHRIDFVEPPLPEVLVVPGVFADGDRQPHAVQLDHLLPLCRREVTLLVEDVVERQQPLVLLEHEVALVQQNSRIHGRLARATLSRQRHAGQNRGR